MVTTSKAYIDLRGRETIWSQSQKDIIKKMNECKRLNQAYQDCFHKIQDRVEKPFDSISEIYIFSKFDAFIKRSLKIMDIFKTIDSYSSLVECKIEGTKKNSNL